MAFFLATACHAGELPAVDPADRVACEALRALDLGEAAAAPVQLSVAEVLPATGDQPALCRVAGVVSPQVGFEVRLPVAGWNTRLLVTGCTNLCGIIQAEGMEDALARGYATATTDLGHRTGDPADARWAFNNPALEADYGHRATHVTTLVAKDLVANFYGDGPAWAYFRGCSTGGRQGLVAAERYPADFDGIIAGAPFDQSLSVPQMAWALAANAGPDGKPLLGRAEFDLLGKAALKACDGADGQADGVIADPAACNFRPEELVCAPPAGEGAAARPCLTPPQAEAARRIYAGPATRAGKPWSSGGAPVGSESTWAKSLLAPPGERPFFRFIVENWSRYLAWDPDPPFPPSVPDAIAGPKLPPVDFDAGPGQFSATAAVAGYRGDLDRFRARGGRLILYHGWADESLMPAHTLDYWGKVQARLGADEVDEFGRLFLVPGMRHCGGGPGATDIDYLTALERWVEDGAAPDRLVAHKVRDAVPTFERQPRFPLPASRVEATRDIAPWRRKVP